MNDNHTPEAPAEIQRNTKSKRTRATPPPFPPKPMREATEYATAYGTPALPHMRKERKRVHPLLLVFLALVATLVLIIVIASASAAAGRSGASQGQVDSAVAAAVKDAETAADARVAACQTAIDDLKTGSTTMANAFSDQIQLTLDVARYGLTASTAAQQETINQSINDATAQLSASGAVCE